MRSACVPADPESKGGSEATVGIAKSDLVPTDHNLRDAYDSFAEHARAVFCERVNTREHRITRRAPAVASPSALLYEYLRALRVPIDDEPGWTRAVIVEQDTSGTPRPVGVRQWDELRVGLRSRRPR